MAKDYDGSTLTIQQMFDRAYIGLKSQNFDKSMDVPGRAPWCLYSSKDKYGTPMHCAWGWVDTQMAENPSNEGAQVASLRARRIGIAATLNEHELVFAVKLQAAHDGTNSHYASQEMPERLEKLRLEYSLNKTED
jgi:hypothetical protein